MANLLQTKLYRPTLRPDLIPRERLHRQLLAGLWSGQAFARKLTLIAAPAGFGKTTLAADFVASVLDTPTGRRSEISNVASAWLSLDEADNEPARFLRYLIAALQSGAESEFTAVGRSLAPLLETGAAPPLESIAETLINEIAAASCPVIVTLDDYHVIDHQGIESLMSFLLDHQPPNLHLIIASRSDPALPLSRLRARGRLLEVRIHDLRFTEDEAAAFLTQTMGLELQPDWISVLEARTEGWIAGLQLAALSLRGRADSEAFIQAFSGSHRYVIDYLVDEVLRHQTPELRHFLIRTSILERLCGPLCDALVSDGTPAPGPSPSALTLQLLERANLFLVPLDDRREWYRYHHLFADSLRSQLDTAQSAALHRRAALWFESGELPLEAVQHARATGDLDFTADMIERAVQLPSTWSSGQLSTLVQWLDALPDAVLSARPALSLHASRALFLTGRVAESERLLDRARAAIQDRDDDDAILHLALADVYRGSIAALRGQVGDGIARLQQALARLPEPALHTRARALDMLGLAYRLSGEAAQAEQYYLQASALGAQAGVAFMAINACCEAAEMQALQGRLDEAERTCRAALSLSDVPIPPHGLAWAILGEIARERNDLATAEQHLQQGLALAQTGGLTDDIQTILSFVVRLRQNLGDLDGARRAQVQVTQMVQAYQVACMTDRAAAQEARLELAQGHLDAAARWAGSFLGNANASPSEISREYEQLTLARVQLASGQTQSALKVLTQALPVARAAGRRRSVIETLLLQAQALHEQSRPAEAVEALSEAVTLAAPERWLRLFLDEGTSLVPLLVHTRALAPQFVDEVLGLLPVSAVAEPPSAAALPVAPSGEALSAREVEILTLLAEGLTNREIGQALYIGVGTVKWYLTHLYDKLDVGNRTQAVACARDLGII
jgi:LuxR family transcriptional regulator, maltose regulon positive regulatory protein